MIYVRICLVSCTRSHRIHTHRHSTSHRAIDAHQSIGREKNLSHWHVHRIIGKSEIEIEIITGNAYYVKTRIQKTEQNMYAIQWTEKKKIFVTVFIFKTPQNNNNICVRLRSILFPSIFIYAT